MEGIRPGIVALFRSPADFIHLKGTKPLGD